MEADRLLPSYFLKFSTEMDEHFCSFASSTHLSVGNREPGFSKGKEEESGCMCNSRDGL